MKNLELILLILISICGHFRMTNVLISVKRKETMHITKLFSYKSLLNCVVIWFHLQYVCLSHFNCLQFLPFNQYKCGKIKNFQFDDSNTCAKFYDKNILFFVISFVDIIINWTLEFTAQCAIYSYQIYLFKWFVF